MKSAYLLLVCAIGGFAISFGLVRWTERRTSSPSEMVEISGGQFIMGTDDPQSFANERPAHPASVGRFWIDRHDVTNAEFQKFVDATGYVTTAERPVDWEEMKKSLPSDTPKPADEKLQPGSLVFTPPGHAVDLRDMSNWWTWTNGADWRHPDGPGSSIAGKDEHPVVHISWDDAAAYARWAGKRLPTEAEWEFAARGGSQKNTRYHWGKTFQTDGKFMCNTYTGEFPVKDTAADGYAGTNPWNAFPPNGYGLFDMAGNVWQWTSDAYHDPTNSSGTRQYVVKGGSFLCNPSYCESYRPTARRGIPPDTGSSHVGFRCVWTPELRKSSSDPRTSGHAANSDKKP
jgi:formylglycine-generating enzyme